MGLTTIETLESGLFSLILSKYRAAIADPRHDEKKPIRASLAIVTRTTSRWLPISWASRAYYCGKDMKRRISH